MPDLVNWDVSVDHINSRKQDLINSIRERNAKILDRQIKEQSVLTELNEIEQEYVNCYNYFYVLNMIYPDKEIRDAAKIAAAELSKFNIELRMDSDFYNFYEELRSSLQGSLDPESQRYLDQSILERRLDGVHLDEDTRNKVKELKQKLSDLQLEFSKNYTEESTKFEFTAEQLNGMSKKFFDSLKKSENGNFIVSLKYPDYFPIMKECKVPETRRKLNIAFDRRCIDKNTVILDELIELRAQLAKTLGFKNFGEYSLVTMCAKSPEKVNDFLDNLADKFRPLIKKELDILLSYKKDECEDLGIEFDGKINPSDLKYYINLKENKEFEVDHSKLQEYFPMNLVFDGIFKIYQLLLGLKFVEIFEFEKYHNELRLFQVNDSETNELMGYFYTDLHPRDGKFGHACVKTLKKGNIKGNQLPVCIMICNFTNQTAELPSLLTHDELKTFFTSLDMPCMKYVQKPTTLNSGYCVETDFLEAPSQMLENWVFDPESIKLMSGHYKDNSALNDEILEKLVKSSRNTSSIFIIARLIMLSKMDLLFHTVNEKKIYKRFVKEYFLLDLEDEGLNFNSGFLHLAAGYQSKYYSYLWSQVYSIDMFESRFHAEGILNPATGMDYRVKILQPGGSMDAIDMLKNFLGREPNEIAFLKKIGIDTS